MLFFSSPQRQRAARSTAYRAESFLSLSFRGRSVGKKKWMRLTLTQVKEEKCTLLQREETYIKLRPPFLRPSRASARHSRLAFKGDVFNHRSHFVRDYKGKQVIKRRRLFKNGKADIPFQVQFSPATVFATYHSAERAASERLDGGSRRKDLNKVFFLMSPVVLRRRRRRHRCASADAGINTGLTQSIKVYQAG